MPTFEITVVDIDIAGDRSGPRSNSASKSKSKCCAGSSPWMETPSPSLLLDQDGPITAQLISPLSE